MNAVFEMTDSADPGIVEIMTYAEFVASNCDGYIVEDPLEVAVAALLIGEQIQLGGGAAPLVTIRRIS